MCVSGRVIIPVEVDSSEADVLHLEISGRGENSIIWGTRNPQVIMTYIILEVYVHVYACVYTYTCIYTHAVTSYTCTHSDISYACTCTCIYTQRHHNRATSNHADRESSKLPK